MDDVPYDDRRVPYAAEEDDGAAAPDPVDDAMFDSTAALNARKLSLKAQLPQFYAAVVVNLFNISHYIAANYHHHMYHNAPTYPDTDEVRYMDLSGYVAGLVAFGVFSLLLEKLSRRTFAYIVSVSYIVNCITQQLANAKVWFHVAHASREISKAASTLLAILYVSEIAQDSNRGCLLVLGQIIFHASYVIILIIEQFHLLLLSYIMSFPWFGVVPPVVVIVCFIFWLPDTPVYFLRRGNKDEAILSLQWLRGGYTAEDAQQEIEDMEDLLRASRSDYNSNITIFEELATKRSLRYTGIVIVLYLVDQFCGVMGAYWALMVLPVSISSSLFSIMFPLSEIACLAGSFIALLVCDRKGRRILLLISLVVCAIGAMAIAICLPFIILDEKLSVAKLLAMIFAMIYLVGFGAGIGTVVIVVVADIFPPKTLNTQLAIKGIFVLLLSFMEDSFMYGDMWEGLLHHGWLWMSTVVCIIGTLFIYMFVPETMNQHSGFPFIENHGYDMLLRNV